MLIVQRTKKPFFLVENKIMEDGNLSDNAKWLYCCLSYLGENAEPENLFRLCGLSQLKIKDGITLLRDEGYIE
jgi:hypothetical protein